MAKTGKKSGLGRGLGALMGESAEEIGAPLSTEDNEAEKVPMNRENDEIKTPESTKPAVYVEEDDHVEIRGVVERVAKQDGEVPLSQVLPNPSQPRKQFKKEEIEELANSIEREGLLQPILVRKVGDGYQIVAGERRWRACKLLGLQNVAVRMVEANDDKALELALIENVQRADLNPIEEAYGYRGLIELRGMTQSQVAEVVSKGRSTIANALRLLELPEQAQQMLYEELITAGHARAILSIPTEEGRMKLTERLAKERLSVREAENLARLLSGAESGKRESTPRVPVPASFRKVAQDLKKRLQTNVRVKNSGGKNRIEIEFKDEEDLKRLFEQLVGE